jgi:RNA exonuclease 4
MNLNSTIKRVKSLIRKTRKNIGISGGMNRKPQFKLSAAAAPYVPSSFTAPTAPVESKAEKEVVKALASSMAATNDSPNFMSMAMNALTKINAVAMDCEMVGVGVDGRKSALAHIAIVDVNGKILMNEYVIPRGGTSAITDYRTAFSGIKEGNLDRLHKRKHSFNNIQKRAVRLLEGKIIVGHALINDFKALELDMDDYKTWDTAVKEEYLRTHPYYGKQPRKLKNLAAEIGNVIQVPNPDKKGHSPVEDARASMNLYRHYVLKMPKIEYANMSK